MSIIILSFEDFPFTRSTQVVCTMNFSTKNCKISKFLTATSFFEKRPSCSCLVSYVRWFLVSVFFLILLPSKQENLIGRFCDVIILRVCQHGDGLLVQCELRLVYCLSNIYLVYLAFSLD